MKILLTSVALLSSCLLCHAEELNVVNNCAQSIFVKSENTNSGNFKLEPRQSRKIPVNREARARVLAQNGCDGGGNNCETQEGYLSLAEMHWDGNGKTWYDVSQVDGYNLPIKMEPYNYGAGGKCQSASCNFNIDHDCPENDKVKNRGKAVACKNNNRDHPGTDYAKAMKRVCPTVYSWSKDDQDGMRDCISGNNGLHIIFC